MSYSRTKEKRTGRIILVSFYFVYCVLYGLYFFVYSGGTSDLETGKIVVTMLWIPFLFGAIWLGHNWARYLFLFFILLQIFFSIPLLIASVEEEFTLAPVIWALFLFQISVAVTLIYSSGIRALVRK